MKNEQLLCRKGILHGAMEIACGSWAPIGNDGIAQVPDAESSSADQPGTSQSVAETGARAPNRAEDDSG
jgi:hypothetical protein